MTRLVLALCIALLLAAGATGSLSAQDVPVDRTGRTRGAPTQAELDQHVASIESTRLAAEALGRAVEIDAARRIAPFDLDWGTP